MRLLPESKYYKFFLYMLGIALFGSLGYFIMGGTEWSYLDSLYMTIITISTVGFSEIHQLDGATRIWTIIVIVFGVTGVAVLIKQFIQEMIDFKTYRRKRMEKRIAKMNNHYIVCGFGRMGEVICDKLQAKRQKFVVIEQREMNTNILREKGYIYIAGDATNEDTLMDAGLEQAKGIVIVLGSDPDNLFVTMTVKTINPEIFILARCSTIGSNKKFRRAGADKVINPYIAGGHKMAELLLEPELNDSVEIIADLESESFLELGVDQVELTSTPYLIGKSLHDSKLREDYNLMILAIIEADGNIQINPAPEYILEIDHKAVITGRKEDLNRFKELNLTTQ